MSNNSLTDKLISLWDNNKLSHFYIVQPSPAEENPREFIKEWVNNFVAKAMASEKGYSADEALHKMKLGVGDILRISKEDENENYLVDDDQFRDFFRFQNYRPLELKQRFIIIEDSHSITKTLSNKLLKTLEEPAESTTIFLLDPYRKKILPTIASRAIYIRVPTKKRIESSTPIELFSNYLSSKDHDEELIATVSQIEANSQNLMPLYDYLKGKKGLEHKFVEELTQYVNQRGFSYLQLEQYSNALKWYEKAATFNNYSPEKLAGLMLSLN